MSARYASVHMWELSESMTGQKVHQFCFLFTASCMDGDIRLVDGYTGWEGRLEVCFNRRWGTVGGETWDVTETEVICRQLGYQYQSIEAGMNLGIE